MTAKEIAETILHEPYKLTVLGTKDLARAYLDLEKDYEYMCICVHNAINDSSGDSDRVYLWCQLRSAIKSQHLDKEFIERLKQLDTEN